MNLTLVGLSDVIYEYYRLRYECAELCHEYYYVLVSMEYHIQTTRLTVALSSLAYYSCL